MPIASKFVWESENAFGPIKLVLFQMCMLFMMLRCNCFSLAFILKVYSGSSPKMLQEVHCFFDMSSPRLIKLTKLGTVKVIFEIISRIPEIKSKMFFDTYV